MHVPYNKLIACLEKKLNNINNSQFGYKNVMHPPVLCAGAELG
jgi:hypothetical protein